MDSPSSSVESQSSLPLTIASNTACPSGPAVLDALAMLAPPTEWPRGSVRIHATADLLLVDLTFEESARREVTVPADCESRATTVALLIATWTGKLSSDAAAMPVLPAPVPAPPSPTAPSPIAPLSTSATHSSSAPPRTTDRELGAGLLLAISGGIAPGFALHFVQTRAPRGLGWQAALTLPARRNQSSTGWTRASASAELNARASLGRLAASLDAGLAAAYTLTSGQGYSIDQDLQSVTAGLVAGLRLALPWRRLQLWADLRIYRWLFPQKVAVTTVEGTPVTTVSLPSSDLHFTVGVSYVFH
jgi:hypothetical protein